MNEMQPDSRSSVDPTPAEPDASRSAQPVEVSPNQPERLEADPNNPGDHVTTHEEDDDPESNAGEFLDGN